MLPEKYLENTCSYSVSMLALENKPQKSGLRQDELSCLKTYRKREELIVMLVVIIFLGVEWRWGWVGKKTLPLSNTQM